MSMDILPRIGGQWGEKDPNGQWQVLEKAGMISQRPAPGVAGEGNTIDDGGLGREGFFASRAIRGSVANPVMPPSTGTRPKMPIGDMPFKRDPTSRGAVKTRRCKRYPRDRRKQNRDHQKRRGPSKE